MLQSGIETRRRLCRSTIKRRSFSEGRLWGILRILFLNKSPVEISETQEELNVEYEFGAFVTMNIRYFRWIHINPVSWHDKSQELGVGDTELPLLNIQEAACISKLSKDFLDIDLVIFGWLGVD